MESEQLTPFGKRTKERLKKLNRDDAWVLAQFKKKEIFIDKDRYYGILTGEVKSKQHELAIGKLLDEEEKIQKIVKRTGIKRG